MSSETRLKCGCKSKIFSVYLTKKQTIATRCHKCKKNFVEGAVKTPAPQKNVQAQEILEEARR